MHKWWSIENPVAFSKLNNNFWYVVNEVIFVQPWVSVYRQVQRNTLKKCSNKPNKGFKKSTLKKLGSVPLNTKSRFYSRVYVHPVPYPMCYGTPCIYNVCTGHSGQFVACPQKCFKVFFLILLFQPFSSYVHVTYLKAKSGTYCSTKPLKARWDFCRISIHCAYQSYRSKYYHFLNSVLVMTFSVSIFSSQSCFWPLSVLTTHFIRI
jgi:hypothetical protein